MPHDFSPYDSPYRDIFNYHFAVDGSGLRTEHKIIDESNYDDSENRYDIGIRDLEDFSINDLAEHK